MAWGFAGSQTARFSQFVRGPLAALRHLAHLLRREPDTEIGHNAAGGWMVLVMLALLRSRWRRGCAPMTTPTPRGRCSSYVGKELERLAVAHPRGQLHADPDRGACCISCAILIYFGLKRHDLVRPMITGRKLLPDAMTPPRFVSPLRAVVLFAIAAVSWGCP